MSQSEDAAGEAPQGETSMEDVLASIRRILDDGAAPTPPATPAEDVFVLDEAMMIEEHEPVAQHSTTETSLDEHAPLLAPEAQTAASSSLGNLVRTLTERRTQVFREGPTLEDLVREEMRPMVKSWLDANIAPMVERLVREEIERVVRRAAG